MKSLFVTAMTAFSVCLLAIPASGDDLIDGVRRLGREIDRRIDVDVNRRGVGVRVGPLSVGAGRSDDIPAWIFRSSDLNGTAVIDKSGRWLGTLEEHVVDVRTGNVRYAAVSLPELHDRDMLFAIPWSKLEPVMGDRLAFVLHVPVDTLAAATGFSRDAWPNVADRRWAEEVDVYYGVIVKEGDLKSDFGTDVESVEESPRVSRSRTLIGMPVDSGHNQGRLVEMLIDLQDGHVRYGLVAFPHGPAGHSEIYTYPWPMFQQTRTPEDEVYFTLVMERERFQRAPRFRDDEWPNFRDPEWSEEIDRHYDIERDQDEAPALEPIPQRTLPSDDN